MALTFYFIKVYSFLSSNIKIDAQKIKITDMFILIINFFCC